MSQITRCPACATMFKVAAEQFEAAQGWVRCGCCGEVFDAAQHLVSTDVAALKDDAVPAVPFVSEDAFEVLAAAQDEEPAPDIGAFPPVAALTPSVEAPTEVAAEPAAVETNPGITPLALLEPAEPASVPEPEPEPEPEPALTPAPELSFVRDARRKAFWKRPLVRVLLGLVFLLLLTALLLQWVLQQKDNLAATDPRLAPFLQALCGPLNCTIRPPRRIESLLIDSSSFRKTGPDMYSLSFVLKNNSAAVLEMPSLEVTLTDIQEQALVRRVLAPREFGATTAALAAHGELAGVITLKVAGEPVPGAPLVPPLPVTGYRVVAFYP